MAVGDRLLALGYQQLIVMNTGSACIIIPNQQHIFNLLKINVLILILKHKMFRIEHFLFGVEHHREPIL